MPHKGFWDFFWEAKWLKLKWDAGQRKEKVGEDKDPSNVATEQGPERETTWEDSVWWNIGEECLLPDLKWPPMLYLSTPLWYPHHSPLLTQSQSPFMKGREKYQTWNTPPWWVKWKLGQYLEERAQQRRLELLRGVVLGRAKCDPGVKVGSKRWQKATYSVSICPLPRVLSYTGERTEILYPMHDRVSYLFIGTFR